MANVTMDLNELKSLENKIIKAKEETENVKNDLQNKIDALQKEKENLIKNQKRVILTKVIKRQIYTMPFDWVKMKETLIDVITKIEPTCFNHTYNFPITIDANRFIHSIINILYDTNGKVSKEYKSMKEEKEVKDEYEFINLDSIPKLKRDNEYFAMQEENSSLKKENNKLQKRLDNIEKDNDKKLSEQQTLYELKYKELEQEFATFKGDKTKMSIENKLKTLEEENKKLKEENSKLKNKRWKLW